jgi:hypothetical protein
MYVYQSKKNPIYTLYLYVYPNKLKINLRNFFASNLDIALKKMAQHTLNMSIIIFPISLYILIVWTRITDSLWKHFAKVSLSFRSVRSERGGILSFAILAVFLLCSDIYVSWISGKGEVIV